MTLKRIEPLTNRHDLGYVLLWQDELAEIIRLMSQLDSSSISIEADGWALTDGATDLPNIRTKRIKEFKASVTRPAEDDQGESVLKIELSKNVSRIEDTNADLLTTGALNAIKSLLKRCERMPRGRLSELIRGGVGLGPILMPIAAVFVVLFVYAVLYTLTIIGMYGFIGQGSVSVPQPAFIGYWVVAALSGIAWIGGSRQAKATMYKGTRAEAPTWWQEHRSDIGINVACSVVFLIVGVLIGHLWP